MAFMLRAKEAVQAEFREVGATGVFIAHTEADWRHSRYMLKHNTKRRLRPLTYEEALLKIYQSPELREQLKGKWFYLKGKGLTLSGYYTFNEKGELTPGKGADIENTLSAFEGTKQLSFSVHKDDDANDFRSRFLLTAHFEPSAPAPVVVGVVDHGGFELKALLRGARLKLPELPKGLPDVRKLVEALRKQKAP